MKFMILVKSNPNLENLENSTDAMNDPAIKASRAGWMTSTKSSRRPV